MGVCAYILDERISGNFLDNRSMVNLFTRSGRFGKTLTLSMLKYFFEDAYDFCGNKEDYYFRNYFALEFDRHRYILEGDVLSEEEKKEYRDYLNKKEDWHDGG